MPRVHHSTASIIMDASNIRALLTPATLDTDLQFSVIVAADDVAQLEWVYKGDKLGLDELALKAAGIFIEYVSFTATTELIYTQLRRRPLLRTFIAEGSSVPQQLRKAYRAQYQTAVTLLATTRSDLTTYFGNQTDRPTTYMSALLDDARLIRRHLPALNMRVAIIARPSNNERIEHFGWDARNVLLEFDTHEDPGLDFNELAESDVHVEFISPGAIRNHGGRQFLRIFVFDTPTCGISSDDLRVMLDSLKIASTYTGRPPGSLTIQV